MRIRTRYLLLACLLGAAVVVLPALASSETIPTISAYDEPGIYGGHAWQPSTATVSPSGVVEFANPYTTVPHGLKFTGGTAGVTPSCSGIPAAAGEPTGATNWHGECLFTTPGTYTFICTVHPTEMKGTITVAANGTTTTTTTTPTTTTTTTTPTNPLESSSGSALLSSPSLHSIQRGGSIRGSLQISPAASGDRLEVDVFARGASLAKHSTRIRVGRFVRNSLSAGKLSFTIRLNAKARSALKRHRRLALSIKIVLSSLHGQTTTLTRSVVEHP